MPTKKKKNTKERILDNAEALTLEKGFSGMSIDDILKATEITKGAFFYHFKTKAELARALVERYWENDYKLFEQFSKRADELSEDPLQSMLIFLKLFEEFIEQLADPPGGCIFASYVYEIQQFDLGIREFIADGFQEWQQLYEHRIEQIMQKYPPKIEIDARELAEMIVCIIEGGFILSKSSQDPQVIARSVRQFRRYLQLIFAK